MNSSPSERTDGLRREIERTALRLKMGVEHVTGLARPTVGATPRIPVWTRHKATVYRYRRDDPASPSQRRNVPLVLVMSLVTRPTVFDLQPGNSVIETLLGDGHDVFMIDWGVPDAVDSANSLSTYCDDYLPRAIDAILDESGSTEVLLIGYCLGGVMSMLTLAGHRDIAARALIAIATPIDFAPMKTLTAILRDDRLDLDTVLDETGNVPASTILRSFRINEPTGDVTTYLNLWNSLLDPRRLEAHQALIEWSSQHIPFPGAAFKDIVGLFIRGDALLRGRIPLGRRVVDTATITLPVLAVEGERDTLVPAESTAPIGRALPNAHLEQLRVPSGHAGMLLGSRAQRTVLPAILSWLDVYTRDEVA